MESLDSLPYIDRVPTQAERDQARALLTKQLPANHAHILHPSIPAPPEVAFSAAMLPEIERAGTNGPRQGGVDLSRYEAPAEPSSDSDEAALRQILRHVYVSSTFLSDRQTNLRLLDDMGKNAWLTGNFQLEHVLANLERELSALKAESEAVNKARKIAQEQSSGELQTLEENWKRGIGQVLEIQVATDKLRQQIADQRRRAASALP